MTTQIPTSQASPTDSFEEAVARRRSVRAERDRQVTALYPHARTFALLRAEAVTDVVDATEAFSRVPATLTLVTPDHADPGRDHLYVGPYPVLSRNLHWDKAFEELDFATSDGGREIRGHLRITHSRLRAFGVLDVGGRSYAVEYEVKPQRYRMRIAKDAAYLVGQRAEIHWDPNSAKWRDASWSDQYLVGFTYGVNGETIIDDELVYSFVASFDDIPTGTVWRPPAGRYGGYLNHERRLTFALDAGQRTPSGRGTEYLPYQLSVKLSEFAYDFVGGMVVGDPGYQGQVYGVIGDWAGAHVGGLYHLEQPGRTNLIAVHDRELFVGTERVPGSRVEGDRVLWDSLSADLAQATGLPRSGWLAFSLDGAEIVQSSCHATGRRIHPDDALDVVGQLAAIPGLGDCLRQGRVASTNPDHTLSALVRMSQFAQDGDHKYFDVVQQGAMDDFYTILQNFMDPDLRRDFFNPGPPPPLSPGLYGIAHTRGTKGSEPTSWYRSLSVPYTATALANFSPDPAARKINGRRATTRLTDTTSTSDVMQAQGPLLYQRRYQQKHENLAWFLLDQETNAASYAPVIDQKVEQWIAEARADGAGTPEQLAELEKQIRQIGEHAKKHKQYWAFALYTYTTSSSYLNMLKTIVLTGAEIDGSEFSQRVQRTVGLLNVLDTTSYFSEQYAFLLELFSLGVLLPQMVDFGTEFQGFSFAVKQIIDKFVQQYLHSPDPKMREAAERLQREATAEFVADVLAFMRASYVVSLGMNNWSFFAQTFEGKWRVRFANTPVYIGNLIALGAAGYLLSMFLSGNADWDGLDDSQKVFVITSGAGILAQAGFTLLQRGVALAAVWDPAEKVAVNLRKFIKPSLINDALANGAAGFRGWLLSTNGPKIPADRISIRQAFAARSLFSAEAADIIGHSRRQRFVGVIFGRNLTQFMARAMCGAFSIVGIVMSAIDLGRSDEPLEKAAHAMFLIASCLELVAVVGSWALAGSALAVGGMLVTTIFAVVSVVGLVALVVGAVLLMIFWHRPQKTPVEKFAEKAGSLYMPRKAAIEYFEMYQPLGQAQRAGIAVLPGGRSDRALTIGSDGRVSQGAFDASGHTAFYLFTDALGRVQIGAPVRDDKAAPALLALAVDDAGRITSRNAIGMDSATDTRLLWFADIVGDPRYERSENGSERLRSAPFKLYTAHPGSGVRRYLDIDGGGGWRLRDGDGAVLDLRMEVTKPAELAMNDVLWYTVAHDEQAEPVLQIPGSLPRHWSITPQLPEGVEFSAEDGIVAMRRGYDVPAAPRRAYTLTVTNDVGTLTTSFDLEVRVPEFDVAEA